MGFGKVFGVYLVGHENLFIIVPIDEPLKIYHISSGDIV